MEKNTDQITGKVIKQQLFSFQFQDSKFKGKEEEKGKHSKQFVKQHKMQITSFATNYQKNDLMKTKLEANFKKEETRKEIKHI